MQKVFIKGVPGKGKEVIAKLEELGGQNIYNYNGESGLFMIDYLSDKILRLEERELIYDYDEIFLDESIE